MLFEIEILNQRTKGVDFYVFKFSRKIYQRRVVTYKSFWVCRPSSRKEDDIYDLPLHTSQVKSSLFQIFCIKMVDDDVLMITKMIIQSDRRTACCDASIAEETMEKG